MKTKEEIIQWYKDNGYYKELVKEVEKQHGTSFEDFISGRNGYNLSPFVLITWSISELGDDYWMEARNRFADWFNKETDKHPTQPAPSKEIDWEQRRYEIAKEVICAELTAPIIPGVDPNPSVAELVGRTITLTDALINELKKNKEEQS